MLLAKIQSVGVETGGLSGHVRARALERGAYILRQGEKNDNLFLLKNGLIKLVYSTAEGAEYTKSFIDAGEIFASLTSILGNEPSTFSAVCLEPVEIEQLPYATIAGLADTDSAMLRFSKQIFQQLALKKERREYEFLCLTATERYEKFLEEAPSIAKRLTQIEIAAYLGITPVALSRLKARRLDKRRVG